jgi:hypothetical protein
MLKSYRFNSAFKLAFQFQKPGFRGGRRARGFSALGELEVVVVFDGALGCERAGVTEGVGEGGEEDWGRGQKEATVEGGLGAWGVWWRDRCE